MQKNKIEKTEVVIYLGSIMYKTEDSILLNSSIALDVTYYNDFFKTEIISAAKAHNAIPEFEMKGRRYFIVLNLNSLKFFLRDFKIIEKRWPNLINFKIETHPKSDKILRKILQNEFIFN